MPEVEEAGEGIRGQAKGTAQPAGAAQGSGNLRKGPCPALCPSDM